MTSLDIWNFLRNQNFRYQDWYTDPSILAIINDINERYKNKLEYLIEKMVPQDITEEIINRIKSNKNIIITGTGGIGKSSTILQTLYKLDKKRIPYLVLDIENLDPAISAKELGKNMNLPHSPVNILENIAQDRKCVLIIDQLDNVGSVLGIRTIFFDCIHEIIKNSELYPNISLLLACREFDLKNDYRLRNLLEKYEIDKIKIEPLSIDLIKNYIDDLGLDSNQLNSSQLEILSIPIHLKLFSDVIKSVNYTVLTFESILDLYNEYWKTKQRDIRNRLGHSINWNGVTDIICAYMSHNQVLSVPEPVLDDYSSDAEAMSSEGILILDSNKYSFFHRSFFDYAFARRFVTQDNDILSFLTNDEQHLFRRSQVRQVLLYERSFDFESYIRDLKSLLNNVNIRFHIKKIILELLSELNDPKEEEWNVIVSFIENKNHSLHTESWAIMHRSLSWFKLLDSLKVFDTYLGSDNDLLIDKAIGILYSVTNQDYEERIPELLLNYLNISDKWNDRVIRIMEWADLSIGDNYYNLFLRLIDEGIFENVYKDNDYWEHIQYSNLNKLLNKFPKRVCQVIGHYLKRKLKLALENGQKNPFDHNYDGPGKIPQDAFDKEIFIKLADNSPKGFCDFVLPIMLELMELNINNATNSPLKDEVWRYRHYGEVFFADDVILLSAEKALQKLALNQKTIFRQYETILKYSNFESAHYLLIRSYTVNGKEFADKAVDFFNKYLTAIETGYTNDNFWASRQLIEAISPFCSENKFKKLETLLFDYFPYNLSTLNKICVSYPFFIESIYEFNYYAHTQMGLLEGIIEVRRSKKIQFRLNYLSRFLGIKSVEKPNYRRSAIVRSPIKEEEALKFDDEDWLNAISKYNKKGVGLEGGALELSRLLEKLVKDDPNRFADLISKFPDNANVFYFEAVLRGITDSNADLDKVVNVCKRCHELPNRPCGRWITQPLTNFAKEGLTEDILDLISWYAINDPDPEEELWNTDNSHGVAYYGGKIHDAGLNSVRGIVADSIGIIIYNNKDFIPYFLPILNKMVKDKSLAVRSRVAKALIGLLRHNRSSAIELFKKLCNTKSILLKTPYIQRFILYILEDNFNDIFNIIQRMLLSENHDLNKGGAMLIAYTSLILGYEVPQLRFCLYGSEKHRLGVATAFSEYLPYPSVTLTKDVLSFLFNDPSKDVRLTASTCFRELNDDNITNYIDLINDFINNNQSEFRNLIYALDKIAILPDITIKLFVRFFDIYGSEAGDIRTGTSATAMKAAELVFKMYGQSMDNEISIKCLDLIDKALKIKVPGVEREISDFDR